MSGDDQELEELATVTPITRESVTIDLEDQELDVEELADLIETTVAVLESEDQELELEELEAPRYAVYDRRLERFVSGPVHAGSPVLSAAELEPARFELRPV